MNTGSGRHARAELRWSGGAARCAQVKGRSVHHYWPMLSPYFRDVLLAPHRRVEGDGVDWEWDEPEGAAPPTARELRELRRRLQLAREMLEENFAEGVVRRNGEHGSDELVRGMRAATAELIERDDATLGTFAGRTRAGVRLHSWGCDRAAAVVHAAADEKEETAVRRIGPADAGGANRRAAWVAGLGLLLVGGGAVWWRQRGGEFAAEKRPTMAARAEGVGRADGPGAEHAVAGSLAQRAAEWREQERKRRGENAGDDRGGPNGRDAGRETANAAESAMRAAVASTGAVPQALPVAKPVTGPAAAPAPIDGSGNHRAAPAAPHRPSGSSRAKAETGGKAAGRQGTAAAARVGNAERDGKNSEADTAATGSPTTSDAEEKSGAADVDRTAVAAASARGTERKADEAATAKLLPEDPREARAAVSFPEDATNTPNASNAPNAVRAQQTDRAADWEAGAWLRIGAWRPRLLVDEILPTRPEKEGAAEDVRELAVRRAEERRGQLPAALVAATVDSGLEFLWPGEMSADELRWEGPGDGQRRVGAVDFRPRASGTWRLVRADTGEGVAWVEVGDGRWRVGTKAGWRVRGWLAAPAAWTWRAREKDALPVGWEERTEGERRCVVFPLAAAEARAIALFDAASGWALVSELAGGPDDARPAVAGRQ